MRRLKQLEQERGNLHLVIPELVRQHGQIGAGQELGVTSATINRWLKRNGYKAVRTVNYIRINTEGGAA